jgi:hypothetical protein
MSLRFLAWTTALRLASHPEQLPSLPRLVDTPSAWGKASQHRPGPADSGRARVLSKIRALLAKAEATGYAAEAEALTAKAQHLMTRHAIDEALLLAHNDESADTAASSYGAELVPGMQRQAAAVDHEFERLFPSTHEVDLGHLYSQRGWQAGREAADRASFVAGRLAAK